MASVASGTRKHDKSTASTPTTPWFIAEDVKTVSQARSPVALVTGATSGLGYAIARDLSGSGVHVIVHGPDAATAEDAFIRLMAEGVDPARLDLAIADFARLSDVADLARYVSNRYHRIDVLVNNAAVVGPGARTVTSDGNELTFQVNYLAPSLLTQLLTRSYVPAAAG